nr:hypothetical protein [Pseudoxanthomonas winnipegensis]
MATAQQVPDDRSAGAQATQATQDTQDTAAPPPGLSAGSDVPTLGEVKALPPEEGEVLDLYRFRNPIQVDPNPFSKAYQPPPSVKDISESGGYVAYGLSKLVGAAAKGPAGDPRRQRSGPPPDRAPATAEPGADGPRRPHLRRGRPGLCGRRVGQRCEQVSA